MDSGNFLLMKSILEVKKHAVLRAKNGQEAVDICCSNSEIHLVFMDIKMPVMNGFEALKKNKCFQSKAARYCPICLCFSRRP
jgi:CheY-like chemotaxis protein